MSVIKKGGKTFVYPIDTECKHKGEILVENDLPYTCTLNQTDIEENKNKYYIMQIIKMSSQYILFTKFGRTGSTRKVIYKDFPTSSAAIMAFEKQFKSKTGNNWRSKDNFVKKDGKYFMAEITYETTEDIPAIVKPIDTKSKLDDRVQYLMRLLSDVDTMNKALIELEIDPLKMPLGKISADQLEKAKNILKNISNVMSNQNEKELMKLSSNFYTLIPYNCGMKKPPVIATKELLDNYNNLIEELKNIAVAVKITNDIKNNIDKHPCDVVYDSLNTEIKSLDKNSDLWKHLCDYVYNTHASTHYYKTQVVDIFQISRQGESIKYDAYSKDIPNKTLLWHGSRVVNFCSIMQRGLLLNPESLGVFICGKMLGYGVYFSDTFSKSFNYCDVHSSNDIGVLLLCEVALGNTLVRTQSDSQLGPKDMKKFGTHSTWGKGQKTPGDQVLVNNIRIPNSKLVDSKVKSVLLYNEYVIYNTDQIKQSYLVVVKKK